MKPFHIGKYMARRSPYVVRHSVLITGKIKKLQYGPNELILMRGHKLDIEKTLENYWLCLEIKY